MRPPIRTLVVDDHPEIRRHIIELLQKENDIELVGQCGDGRSAIASIEEEMPDLLFLDVRLPRMTGFDAIQRVTTIRLPVVVIVSGYTEFAFPAFEVAAADYLLKPIDDERFYVALERARVFSAGCAGYSATSNSVLSSTRRRKCFATRTCWPSKQAAGTQRWLWMASIGSRRLETTPGCMSGHHRTSSIKR